MSILQFPADRIVGVLDWPGSRYQDGPLLATGTVTVPDDALVSLEVADVVGTEQTGPGSWSVVHGHGSIDLDFLRGLPSTAIDSLTIRQAAESTVAAVGHLAAGLCRLYLGWTGFSDAVLPAVAAFGFAARLPRLRRLGVQDLVITPGELAGLRAELPGIEVG